MAQKERQKVTEDQVTGLKYFKRLTPLLKRLHEVGCERDKAGNRGLHFDQLSGLYLLFIFNPVLSSLRGLQQASELKKVQRKLGCKRASLGSLSEAAHVFDADALEQVVTELGDQLEPLVQDERLEQVPHLIEIVDGTLLKALPRVVEAMWYSIERQGQVPRLAAAHPLLGDPGDTDPGRGHQRQ